MTQTDQSQSHRSPFKAFQFCPACGTKTLKSNGCKYLRCSACGFSYYINPAVAVVALLKNEQGQYLFARRKYDPGKGKLDFPGGFVDLDETLEEGLKREIREELNLHISHMTYFASYPTRYPFDGIVYQPIDAIFECRVKDWKNLQVGDDVETVFFLYPHQVLPEELAFQSGALILQQLVLQEKNMENL